MGCNHQDLIKFNQKSIELLDEVRKEYETEIYPIVLNCSVGPRADGYVPSTIMSPEQAQQYHKTQIDIISQTKADMITGLTMNYPEEAIGIVRAAKEAGMPVIISLTVETDGKLSTGQSLKEAIEMVDESTNKIPAYYMINCSHPTSFINLLNLDEDWTQRIHGVKCNASKKSHAELEQCTEIDEGDPIEFAQDNQQLLYKLKNLNIFGRCCGTDTKHLEQICKTCIHTFDQLKH
jgi:S-methylmethionine-dependent homocysteine/selenocysteine methylase